MRPLISVSAFFSPFILLSDLSLLFWCKIINNTELLSYFLRRFTCFTINLPLIIVATLAQQSSIRALMSRQLEASKSQSSSSWLDKFMNCQSQGSTRSLSEFLDKGFQIQGGSLALQCSQNSIIFLRGADLTFGRQISSSTPVSSIIFLSSWDFLATFSQTQNLPWSEAMSMTLFIIIIKEYKFE